MSATTDDDQSGMMGWWTGDALDTPVYLKSRMICGILIGTSATILFTYILLQMERQTTNYNAALMESAIGERDTQLELEEESDVQSSRTHHTSSSQSHHQTTASNSDYIHASGDHDDDMSIHSTTSSKMGGVASISPKSVLSKITSAKANVDGIFKPGDTRRRQLSTAQQIQVIVHVMIVILFIYLLLVFLPGSIWLSFVAVIIVWIMALQSYLRDEIARRQRIDRIVTMIGLFSIIAGSLALVTYCHLALKEGNIYEGPARIVGYDTSNYSNKDGSTMRADVIVAWGGSWGCPDTQDTQCQATVQGALCETEYETNTSPPGNSDNGWGNRHSRSRRVQQKQTNNEARKLEEEIIEEEEEMQEEDEEVIEEESEEVDELSAELNTETEIHVEEEDTLEAEVKVMESNSTDAEEEEELTDITVSEAFVAGASEGEAEQLEVDNQNLQNELDAANEEINELNEEVNEVIDEEMNEYVYDDVYYEDEYWQTQDWDSIWGEYACEDLFDSDIASVSLDLDKAPGSDHAPTINIYGSCNTCTAYILDYYSTEHFQNIRQYENQAYLYYVTGFFFMVGAAILALFERKRGPNRESKIVLLSQDGGVAA